MYYENTFLCKHGLRPGTRHHGMGVLIDGFVSRTDTIQKAAARRLSTEFGQCEYSWVRGTRRGTVLYVDGIKREESYKDTERLDKRGVFVV